VGYRARTTDAGCRVGSPRAPPDGPPAGVGGGAVCGRGGRGSHPGRRASGVVVTTTVRGRSRSGGEGCLPRRHFRSLCCLGYHSLCDSRRYREALGTAVARVDRVRRLAVGAAGTSVNCRYQFEATEPHAWPRRPAVADVRDGSMALQVSRHPPRRPASSGPQSRSKIKS
jgi:hypothetical protein